MKCSLLGFGILFLGCSSSDDATLDSGGDAPVMGADSSTGKDASNKADSPADDTGTGTDSSADAGGTDAIVDAPVDVVMGCTSNNTCTMGDYCEKGNANCNGSGACMQKPVICPKTYKPVCGCDNASYDNDCLAHSAGVSVKYMGTCE
jgi:hypothetical protein